MRGGFIPPLFNFKPMDITKCRDEECPMKTNCKRYTAPADILQSYFTESPRQETKCEMYWGPSSDSVFNQLKDIVNGKETSD